MTWGEFLQAAPELAAAAEALFEKSGVIFVGTIRKDGSPRISPVEPYIVDGKLYLGMMWQSLKALDLLRDSRLTVHSAILDRFAADGEFKLHGRASDVQDLGDRSRFGDVVYKKIGWKPEEPNYHLFAIDIHSAGLFTTDGNKRLVKRWRAGEAVTQFHQG